MAEILRRLVPLALILVGVWSFVFTTPNVVQVHPVVLEQEVAHKNWAKRDAQRMMSQMVGADEARNLGLSEDSSPESVLKKMLSGARVESVSGSEWQSFFGGAFASAASQPPSKTWAMRYGQSSSLPDYLYFSTSEPPIEGALGQDRLVYLSLKRDAKTQYIRLTIMQFSDIINTAPTWLAHPYRQHCAWWLLAALLVYTLIPWPKAGGANVLTYSRGASVVAPDWLGFFLAASFYGIALAAVSYNTYVDVSSAPTFWPQITAWCLFAVIPGLSILVVAFWYAVFKMELSGEKLRITSVTGSREIAFADVMEVRDYEAVAPRWLRVLTWIVVAASGLTSAYLLFVVNQRYPGLEFRMKSGGSIRILISHLPGYRALLEALQRHELLPDSLAGDLALPKFREDGKAKPVGTVVAGTAGVVAVAAIWLMTAPQSPLYGLPEVPKQPITDEQIRTMRKGTEALMNAQRELERAQKTFETAPPQKRDAAYDAYMKTLDRYQELSKRLEL